MRGPWLATTERAIAFFTPTQLNIVSEYAPGFPANVGKEIASVSRRTWETDSGAELNRFRCQGRLTALAFSPDGRQLLSSGDKLRLWDFESGAAIAQFDAPDLGPINCAALSPDGTRIVAGTGYRAENGAPYQRYCVHVIEVASGEEKVRWEHTYPVTAVPVSPDSRFVLAGGERGEMHLWSLP